MMKLKSHLRQKNAFLYDFWTFGIGCAGPEAAVPKINFSIQMPSA
jgi:hypothetical protein